MLWDIVSSGKQKNRPYSLSDITTSKISENMTLK